MNKSPEPIILAVFLGLLALGVGILAYTFPKLEDITNVTSMIPTGKTPQKLKEDEVQASLTPWNSPAQWKTPDNGHRLFISKGIFFYPSLYPDGDYLKVDNGLARTPGGMLITWCRQFGLDFTKATVDRDDPDNDGFSNVVEFKNEQAKASDCDGTKSTNPIDPQSHPSYFSRLRLQKYDSRPFHIEFHGTDQLEGKTVFQIYLKDVPSSQQPKLKHTGDPLGFENYIVGPYQEQIVQKENPNTHTVETVNESTLELDKPDIDFKIILTYRKPIDSPESTADFVMLMPTEVDKVMKVARSQVFTPPYMPDKQYKVFQVTDSGAIVHDTKTNQELTIPKLDPAEWDEVPIPAAATPPPKTP